MANDIILLANTPSISNLIFRRFRGSSDFPYMAKVFNASADADKVEAVMTVDVIANSFSQLINSDPAFDMIFAEINGEVIGVAQGWWTIENDANQYLYELFGCIAPEWRRKGIGQAMLQWLESRSRIIAAEHAHNRPKFFEVNAHQFEIGKMIMLEKNNYRASRYFFQMLRPTLENIPNFTLPAGLEIRPVQPDHFRKIWDADIEAMGDHWGITQKTEEHYQAWVNNNAIFQPHLWQVAWDIATNQIVGQVRSFIPHDENKKYSRKRGYTEFISVSRSWRKRGVARALIARSLETLSDKGMTESTLSVDTQNLSGAVSLYEACGFRAIKRNTIYRKPF